MQFTHVDGRESAHILIYALSTCGWCRKTKNLLDELGVAYDYVDVDLLTGTDYTDAREEISKWNPACSFPTIVVNDEECLVGFQEEKLRKLLAE
jgi:glutaredoxin